jgi:site-specific DNA-methyltransferase (cytosine-N4-specific)
MYLRAHEVAKAAGISKNTLLRWLKAGKVPEVARDRNGWRIFTQDDVARVRAFAERTTPPGEFHATFPGKEEAA